MNLSGLTIARQFALLVGLCALAILVPSAMHGNRLWADMRTAQREADGPAPARQLRDSIRLAQQHRGMSAV